jgi:predicted N-acetyltransferase YhbS
VTGHIDRIEEWHLTRSDEAQIARLLRAAFDDAGSGRSYYQQRHHLRLVLRDPDITGHVALTYRAIRLGGTLVDIAGLAEVATVPERQWQGIATRLLAAALAEVQASAADFVVLFGTSPLYARHGFRAVGNPVTHVPMHGQHTGDVVRQDTPGAQNDMMILHLGGTAWDAAAPVDLLGTKF